MEDLEQNAAYYDKVLISEPNRVNFPLIQKLRNKQSLEPELLFCIILTDQKRWMQNHNVTPETWESVATLDGIWWQNILPEWCKQQNLKYYPIILDIEPAVPNGVADWEGMAAAIDHLLDDCFLFEGNLIYFLPNQSEKIQTDKIILQHSSGTPALSSALYLWGIERKLAGSNIEFVYISEQDKDCPTHSGKHWQWRLKVPQIRELLEIQDFSGALKLLDKHHPKYAELNDSLSFLDKSVSLNLEELNLEARDSIIERISIALWSEKAFRDRGQWMHWYLRIAGAFELALYLLVEKQGNSQYHWQEQTLVFLKDDGSSEILAPTLSISKIVTNLLNSGKMKFKNRDTAQETIFIATKMKENGWSEFKKFYLHNEQEEGFTDLRNKLYHDLRGETIAKLFNKKVDASEKPLAETTVEFLKDIVKWAGILQQVEETNKAYQYQVESIKALLNESPRLVNQTTATLSQPNLT